MVSSEAGTMDGSPVRRVVASRQVVIPKKLLDPHAVKESGRVYIARSTRQRGALVIIPEALISGPENDAMLI